MSQYGKKPNKINAFTVLSQRGLVRRNGGRMLSASTSVLGQVGVVRATPHKYWFFPRARPAPAPLSKRGEPRGVRGSLLVEAKHGNSPSSRALNARAALWIRRKHINKGGFVLWDSSQ